MLPLPSTRSPPKDQLAARDGAAVVARPAARAAATTVERAMARRVPAGREVLFMLVSLEVFVDAAILGKGRVRRPPGCDERHSPPPRMHVGRTGRRRPMRYAW